MALRAGTSGGTSGPKGPKTPVGGRVLQNREWVLSGWLRNPKRNRKPHLSELFSRGPKAELDPIGTIFALTLLKSLFFFSLDFLVFSFSDLPCFFWFVCCPFFSKDFRGSAKRKTLVFFGVSLFSSKKRVGGSG